MADLPEELEEIVKHFPKFWGEAGHLFTTTLYELAKLDRKTIELIRRRCSPMLVGNRHHRAHAGSARSWRRHGRNPQRDPAQHGGVQHQQCRAGAALGRARSGQGRQAGVRTTCRSRADLHQAARSAA